MSIHKETIVTQPTDDKCPITPHHLNDKLQNVNHTLNRIFSQLEQDAPSQITGMTKYDFICRNIDEALLIITFRTKQKERLLKYVKKVKRVVDKL
jgi:hypothetical protein